MRRAVVIFAVFGALAVPAAALGLSGSSGDGTLVVKKGAAPAGQPVVELTVTGSVIGTITNYGRIVISPGINADAPVVTGYDSRANSPIIDSAQVWKGTGMTFRAASGRYTILIYGSGVNLVAVGKGKVKLAGMPDTPRGDGRYAINEKDFVSLPGDQSDWLVIGSNNS